MSSITSLISAGGGSGGGGETHIVTDPSKLLKTVVSRAYIKRNASASQDSRNSTFFTSLTSGTNMSAAVTTATSDTYVTLLNVSNADGGYLHWVLSNGVATANQSATVKITVDGGTPVELVYQPPAIEPSISANRMFIGGGLVVASNTTGTTLDGAFYDYWNNSAAYIGESALKNLEDTTNNVYISSTTYAQGYIQSDLNLLRGMPYQRLYFSSSLLVEVKQSTYNSSIANDYAACMYSLI